MEGTTEYIRRFLSYPEELRSRVGAYLTGWLMRLVDVISGKITDLMEDKNGERYGTWTQPERVY